MPNFDIVKESKIDRTFRVAKIESDFDLNIQNSIEHFKGQIDLSKKWNIGLIVGGSGTGKTTIANEIFKGKLSEKNEYSSKSVIDDMPKNMSVEDISRMFYAVGFGSVPSWLKPYNVLSNGEKMRVDIAKAMSENELTVFDEFTSVVDRQVAKVASMAIHKMIFKTNKQFVAISCHYDIIDWLEPDWVFNTDEMQFHFIMATGNQKNLKLENAAIPSGENLGSIII